MYREEAKHITATAKSSIRIRAAVEGEGSSRRMRTFEKSTI
jgi:hypothetical protein